MFTGLELIFNFYIILALRKVVSHAFLNATQILCTRHLKNNVINYLTNQASVEKRMRCRTVRYLLGQEGLANADSEAEFKERSQETVYGILNNTFLSLPLICKID